MADEQARAQAAQARDVGVLGNVAAVHLIAEVAQHLGDTAHADAADADEMNGSDGKRQASHGRASSPVIGSRSTSASAAPG